jgi:choline kinase
LATLLAVILTAGRSRRLGPLTDHIPKCLLSLNGRPILGRLLGALAAVGVSRAVVVTGYLSDRIERFAATAPLPVELVRNEDYAGTNNAASLLAARDLLRGQPFVLCDGDVVFTASPLPALLASREPSTFAIDCGAADEEAMKVAVGADGLVRKISKAIPLVDAAGESIGIQTIGGAALPLVWDAVATVVRSDAAGAYYEDALQLLIDDGVPFGTSTVAAGSWTEIDTPADLEAARRLLDGG